MGVEVVIQQPMAVLELELCQDFETATTFPRDLNDTAEGTQL